MTKWVYLAGIVDGEGCITISKREPWVDKRGWRMSPSYFPRLEVVNTSYDLMKFLQDKFGGKIYKRKLGKGNRKESFDWKVAATKCGDIIRKIRPFLVIKGKQAKLVLEFCRHMKIAKRKGNYSTIKGVNPKYLEYREKVWSKIKKLNKRGIA